MEKSPAILNELNGISSLLAGISSETPFRVPESYFAQLPETILEKIQMETLPANASAETLRVPTGYFEGLSTHILEKIKTVSPAREEINAELEIVAPLLNTLSKAGPYTVAADYFETADFVTEARKEWQAGKVITFRIARKWMQYAAAAAVTGILITGAFLFADDNKGYGENEIYERSNVSLELNKLSEDELVSYLNNPEHAASVPANSLLASEEELKEVKTHIRQLSDEELNQYLKENGETESFETPVSEKDK